ncbi:MAG: hypothetical protein ACFFF4_06320 [Candidatus Thorarchaeota archaeon]
MVLLKANLGYPTTKQSRIWHMRWHRISVTDIAKQLGISKPMVSKAYRIAQKRIKDLLLHTASTFRIEIQRISPEFGFAVGHCNATKSRSYITFTKELGVQAWFSHFGDCWNCDSYSKCNDYLAKLAMSWKIPIDDSLPPTEKGLLLFRTIMRKLDWIV